MEYSDYKCLASSITWASVKYIYQPSSSASLCSTTKSIPPFITASLSSSSPSSSSNSPRKSPRLKKHKYASPILLNFCLLNQMISRIFLTKYTKLLKQTNPPYQWRVVSIGRTWKQRLNKTTSKYSSFPTCNWMLRKDHWQHSLASTDVGKPQFWSASLEKWKLRKEQE